MAELQKVNPQQLGSHKVGIGTQNVQFVFNFSLTVPAKPLTTGDWGRYCVAPGLYLKGVTADPQFCDWDPKVWWKVEVRFSFKGCFKQFVKSQFPVDDDSQLTIACPLYYYVLR